MFLHCFVHTKKIVKSEHGYLGSMAFILVLLAYFLKLRLFINLQNKKLTLKQIENNEIEPSPIQPQG